MGWAERNKPDTASLRQWAAHGYNGAMPKPPETPFGPIAKALITWLIFALWVPCLATMPGQMESHLRLIDTSGSLAMRLGISAHRDPAVFENAQAKTSGQSHSVGQVYHQSQRFGLLFSPWERQTLSLEIPFHYTYLLIPGFGYGSVWHWDGASLAWRSRLSFGESIHLTLFAGGLIPGQDREAWDWVSDDLSRLSRAALSDSLPQREAQKRFGLLLGWQGDFRLPLPIRHPWLKIQVDMRRPFLVSSLSPATVVDYGLALEIPLLASWNLLLSGGQSRVWKVDALWRASTPQATHFQASLGFSGPYGGGLALGGRYNPRWSEEYLPFVLLGEGGKPIQAKITPEAQAQIFVEMTYRLGRPKSEVKAKASAPLPRPRFRGDKDTDQDSIPDSRDACPKNPEDRDGFRDMDGCPDDDNDNDGIADASDMCPNDAEDRDHFEDGDGCPDLDNDRDGLPDAQDQCPRAKEIINFYHDEDGCPDEKPDRVGPRDLESLAFASGRWDWDTSYTALIRDLIEKMSVYPGTELLIVGHADMQEEQPQALSLQRAKGVADALIRGGVDKVRLRIEGRGASQPTATQRTAAGRRKNRRITLEPH